MDFANASSEEAVPRADSMMQTLRAIGYTLETAVADIIDNSITAGARRIALKFEWHGENSSLVIADDGIGMDEQRLVEAMRPGSINPLTDRSAADLGRFGLGLKTASFSQAKRLTVLSKAQGGAINFRCWDLDHIAETRRWSLLTYLSNDDLRRRLEQQPRGTIVFWEKLDRLTGGLNEGNDDHLAVFTKAVSDVRHHLAMVFHRYLERGLKITINERELEPWDPFLTDEKRHGTTSQVVLDESVGEGPVRVLAYVLPHHSRLTTIAFEDAAGIRGWNAHQGFYIYRNERLLVAGDWLGLFRRDEHHKLARIMVDLPNTLDVAWQIDIRKSVARPPALLRNELDRIARFTRTHASNVYRARGKQLQRGMNLGFTPVWNERIRQGKRFYELNREHPLVRVLLQQPVSSSAIHAALRVIEETVPVPLIALNEAEKPREQARPFEHAEDEVNALLRPLYSSLLAAGRTTAETKKMLALMEPFSHFPHLIEVL